MSEQKHFRRAVDDWDGTVKWNYGQLPLAVQMCILSELKKLSQVFACPNVQAGFRALQKLAKHNEAAFKRRVNAAVQKRAKRAAE